MKKTTRTVLLVLAGLFGIGTLATLGLVAIFASVLSGFGGTGVWTEDAVPERDLPALFAVRLPVKPLRYQSRQLGFQDAYFEVLVQLPPGAAEAFLKSNHLERGEERDCPAEVFEQVRTLDPVVPALRATPFELPPALKADGGSWGLHRSGALLEGAGALWLHLTAFES